VKQKANGTFSLINSKQPNLHQFFCFTELIEIEQTAVLLSAHLSLQFPTQTQFEQCTPVATFVTETLSHSTCESSKTVCSAVT